MVLISTPDSKPFADKYGFDLVSFTNDVNVLEEIREAFKKVGESTGYRGLIETGKMLTRTGKLLWDNLPDIVATCKLDGLLIDQIFSAPMVRAEELKIPYVMVSNALMLWNDPYCPPVFTFSKYRPDFLGKLRHVFLTYVMNHILEFMIRTPGSECPRRLECL